MTPLGVPELPVVKVIRAVSSGVTDWIGQGSLDIMGQLMNAQLLREQMDEARLFKQADINMAGQQGQEQGIMDIATLLALYYGG